MRVCPQVRAGVGVQGRPRVHGAAGARPLIIDVAASAAAVLSGRCWCMHLLYAIVLSTIAAFDSGLLFVVDFPRFSSSSN